MERSTNCKRYTDAVSTLVELEAHVASEPACTARFTAFSCQTSQYEEPDDATRLMLTEKAEDALESKGCDIDEMQTSFRTHIVGARSVEYDAPKLARGGFASNCYVTGNDPNMATHKITARCKPQYDMTDVDGNRVRNFDMTFHSDLAACDISDEAMPQLVEDAQKVAAHNAAQNGYTLDKPEHLACVFSILPHI